MDLEIRYLEHRVPFSRGETVLDALERAGIDAPSSCRAGACQFCLMRAVDGEVPANAQDGLKDSLRKTGHFLSCICKPSQSLSCEPANVVSYRGQTSIIQVKAIGPDVVLVRFARPEKFSFLAGQFVTIQRIDGVARSYSIASRADQVEFFDIHVRRVPNGRLSTWFHQEACAGDVLWIEGPKGDCVYHPGNPNEPLTLIGTGTGIAPLFAIAVDALARGHSGPVSIYHGALSEKSLYWVDEFVSLAFVHKNVTYTRCVLHGPASDGVRIGALNQIVASEQSDTNLKRVYLCGDPGLVRILKKQFFLAGVSLNRLHADAFIGT